MRFGISLGWANVVAARIIVKTAVSILILFRGIRVLLGKNMDTERFRISEGSKVDLGLHPTDFTGDYTDKEDAVKDLGKNVKRLRELQDVLYAQDVYSLLIVFQAMDAAGKDGAIEHVMSGVNPQGCHVVSFKQPSSEELDHDYLWRCQRRCPPAV